MYSHSGLLLPLLALTSHTLAQSTVQKLFFPGPPNDDAWVGSVVSVAGDQTTYAIACTSGTFSCVTGVSVCFSPLPPSPSLLTSSQITLTEGPTNFNLVSQTVTAGISASVSETCTIAGTTSATCVAAVSASLDGQSSAVTTTTMLGTDGFNYHPVTITAGAAKLGSAAATTGSASGNAAAPMVTGMGALGAVGLGVLALL
jgi:hypothetical protein